VVDPGGGGVGVAPITGSPFATGSYPYSVAYSPGRGQLAVANYGDSTVSVFAVNSTTGALTPVTGSPHVEMKRTSWRTEDPEAVSADLSLLLGAMSGRGGGFGFWCPCNARGDASRTGLALVASFTLAPAGLAVYVGGREWRQAARRLRRSPRAGGAAS
jgi:hypothetical protein